MSSNADLQIIDLTRFPIRMYLNDSFFISNSVVCFEPEDIFLGYWLTYHSNFKSKLDYKLLSDIMY